MPTRMLRVNGFSKQLKVIDEGSSVAISCAEIGQGRNADIECRPGARTRALRLDRSVVKSNDLVRDSQAQTETTMMARGGEFRLTILFENMWYEVFGDAFAVIDYHAIDATSRLECVGLDASTGWCKFDRV